jgi:hypothetical protein
LLEGTRCGLDVESELVFREMGQTKQHMKPKNTLIALVGAAGLLVAPSVNAGISLGDTGTLTVSSSPWQYGVGGEFTVSSSTLGTFQTFCIEFNEHISLPGTYQYRVNDGAVAGGAGGTLVNDTFTHLTKDAISLGTAYLYSEFAHGTLQGYFGGNRYDEAGQLQIAIWMLEGEVSATVNSGYYNALNDYFLLAGGTAAMVDSGGAYGVLALNLFSNLNDPNSVRQDQLAIVPEANTMVAGLLLLLPLGASALRIVRKNRTA